MIRYNYSSKLILGGIFMSRKDLEQLSETLIDSAYFMYLNRCYQLDIALNKFYDVYYIFAGANNSLANSSKKDLDIEGWETNNKEIVRIFLRSEYLKNAMQGYRSIEDYTMHIITFAFNLKPPITSKKDYKNKSKNLYYYKVCELIDANNGENEMLNRIKDIIVTFHENNEIINIINQVNNLKHNNNLWFSEVYIPRPAHYLESARDDEDKEKFKEIRDFMEARRNNNFSAKAPSWFGNKEEFKNKKQEKILMDSKWFEPERISLEEYINICYGINPIIKRYVEDIYNCVVDKYPQFELRKIQRS